MIATVTGSLLGTLIGVRHAFEPDHLAAVSTLVSEERGSGATALLGVAWGVGHTISLVAVGLLVVVLRAQMPEGLSDIFELGVACMLIGLGARALVRAWRQGAEGPARPHVHGGMAHRHRGPTAHVHIGRWTLARRPLLVGLVHGLAGSGALTALVLASLPSAASRIIYMALFGLGSTLGMAAMTGLLGWPLARMGRNPRTARLVSATVGTLSACLGVAWGYPLAARMF